jgi:L-threonylcarbamoyladenylate synthase
MTPRKHTIDPSRMQTAFIDEAAAVISRGGVVILPTSGLYGLCGNALNQKTVRRIFSIKNRAREKPLLVLISHRGMMSTIVAAETALANELMDHFWPGKLTLIMQGRKDLPRGLCSDTGKVGVRLVAHPVAAAVVQAVGGPITGTSANLSGAGGCAAIHAVDPKVVQSVELILDAGTLEGGPGSTVVDVTGEAPRILREGVVATGAVMEVFEQFATS